MDSIDYQISPKLARLRRRLIMKQKIRERNQRSFETGLSTAIVQYPFLPLKRPATSLRKYSSNSTEENSRIKTIGKENSYHQMNCMVINLPRVVI
ncbi:hypothetical protein AHAS_Ahas20G0053900 [Arachis hypogaea]